MALWGRASCKLISLSLLEYQLAISPVRVEYAAPIRIFSSTMLSHSSQSPCLLGYVYKQMLRCNWLKFYLWIGFKRGVSPACGRLQRYNLYFVSLGPLYKRNLVWRLLVKFGLLFGSKVSVKLLVREGELAGTIFTFGQISPSSWSEFLKLGGCRNCLLLT